MNFKGLDYRLRVAIVVLACQAAAAVDEVSNPKPREGKRELLGSYFNMRLFWKEGYRWQENPAERKWCMKCQNNRCSRGTGIKIAKCNRDDWRQHFFFSEGRIRSRRNKDVCLKRDGRSIVLSNCSNSQNQKWDTLRKDREFQLRPPGNSEKCASQHHEPKEGEKVYMTSCKRSRSCRTDKWNIY